MFNLKLKIIFESVFCVFTNITKIENKKAYHCKVKAKPHEKMNETGVKPQLKSVTTRKTQT